MAVPYTFGSATSAIPLSQLDSNFATTITLGNTAIQLGNTVTTLNNMSLANVTVSSGNVTVTTLTAPTINSGSGVALSLQSNATTAITIDTSQNVGVGTSSPFNKLTVKTGTNQNLTASSNGFGNLNDANSAWASTQINGNPLIFGYGSFASEAARIDTSGNLLVGGTTSPSGSGNIYSNNRVYVGTTNLDPTFNRSTGLSLTAGGSILSRSAGGWDCGLSSTSGSNITFYTDNGSARVGAGSISSSGSVTAYNVTSDYRLKQNVQPMTNTLSLISQLKPCTYEYIEGNQYSEGFIAHELQAIVPHAVTGKKDAVDADGNPVYQGVDASFLIPHLVAAIQEQQALITQLTTRIAALEAK
jgi:hypothetical protein